MPPPLSATSRVMKIGLSSNAYSQTDLSMIAYWTLRWHLMKVPGVANVVIWGDRFKQLQVQVDPKKLQTYHVTEDEVEAVNPDALDYGVLEVTNAAKNPVGGVIDTPHQKLGVQHIFPRLGSEDLAKVARPPKKKSDGSP